MNLTDMPAFPVFGSRFHGENVEMSSEGGMTLRQYAAVAAMQGMLSGPIENMHEIARAVDRGEYKSVPHGVARSAIAVAHALLAELAK